MGKHRCLIKTIDIERTYGGPQGFWGSGENGYLFSGSWGALVIISRDQREQAHSFGDLGSPAKKQKNKGKASILFDFLKISSASGGLAP